MTRRTYLFKVARVEVARVEAWCPADARQQAANYAQARGIESVDLYVIHEMYVDTVRATPDEHA
jgi:hypothetical protein